MTRWMGLMALGAELCLLSACTGQLTAVGESDPEWMPLATEAEARLVGLSGSDGGSPSEADDAGGDAEDAGEGSDAGAGAVLAPDGSTTGELADASVVGEVDAGAPAPAPPPAAPPPVPPGSGLAALGPLPAELSGLRWPDAPRTTRVVIARTAGAVEAAAAVAGTRVEIIGAVGGGVRISANDVELIADSATSLGQLHVARGVHRVRVSGGRWAGIRLEQPATYYPVTEYRSEWMVEDVLVEDAVIVSNDMAFEIRGRRIALLRNHVTAARYSVWCGDTGPMQSEDLILHENVFLSAGPEATVRFVQVLRSATVGNTISNTAKHNYRIHGTSDLHFASRNLLLGTGVMLGRMPGDQVSRVTFDDNVFHHYAPDLFNPEATLVALRARRNTVYTDVRSSFYGGPMGAGWELANNVVLPYRAPPPG